MTEPNQTALTDKHDELIHYDNETRTPSLTQDQQQRLILRQNPGRVNMTPSPSLTFLP